MSYGKLSGSTQLLVARKLYLLVSVMQMNSNMNNSEYYSVSFLFQWSLKNSLLVFLKFEIHLTTIVSCEMSVGLIPVYCTICVQYTSRPITYLSIDVPASVR